jgi:HK97 family phage prohead protease
MNPTFAIAEVKAAASEHPNGEFEIVMSTDSVDRDGEIIVKGAFAPLPDSIPVHAFHDFSRPIGRVVPQYDDAGRLIGRGFFGSDEESQAMRQKVADGIIGHTSVGFMAAERDRKDGVPHITKAELLEVSFVSVPSNRDAAVLMAKQYDPADADTKATKADRLQTIHDMAVANGATCTGARSAPPAERSDVNAPETATAPQTPADEAGKSVASVVTQARLAAARALLDV